ncbi:MAG: glycerophosphodiester phosphodiesterase [Acidimicrobiia bacterium]
MTAVFAHRGWHEDHRENTVDAFRAAVDLGVDGIELDVRRTADRHYVVHHDAHLEDGRNLVDLAASDLPGWVPSLDDALDACAGVSVNIEIKNNEGDPDLDPGQDVACEVCRVVAERRWHDRVVVSSFNLDTVDRVHATDAAIPTAWLVVDGHDGAAAAAADRGHRGLNPFFGFVDRALVDECDAAGLTVMPWTVDDPQRILELAGWGVAGVITNVPRTAFRVLGRTAP